MCCLVKWTNRLQSKTKIACICLYFISLHQTSASRGSHCFKSCTADFKQTTWILIGSSQSLTSFDCLSTLVGTMNNDCWMEGKASVKLSQLTAKHHGQTPHYTSVGIWQTSDFPMLRRIADDSRKLWHIVVRPDWFFKISVGVSQRRVSTQSVKSASPRIETNTYSINPGY